MTASYAFAGIPGACSPSYYCTAYAYVQDGAATATDVFALGWGQEYRSFYESGFSYYSYTNGEGIYWTPVAGSSSPAFIPLYETSYNSFTGQSTESDCNTDPSQYPACSAFYMDADSSGNLWFDGYLCSNASSCGNGIAEVTNPTTAPTVTVKALFTVSGSPECPEGLYVSRSGRTQTINIVDDCEDEVFRYPLQANGHLGVPPCSRVCRRTLKGIRIPSPWRPDPAGIRSS